jgi:hypothetical protein
MVTLGESRVLLAKSRRLLVTSKRLLRDLEERGVTLDHADATGEAARKNPSDRPQTRSAYAENDENGGSSQRAQRLPVAGPAPWNRPRQPR